MTSGVIGFGDNHNIKIQQVYRDKWESKEYCVLYITEALESPYDEPRYLLKETDLQNGEIHFVLWYKYEFQYVSLVKEPSVATEISDVDLREMLIDYSLKTGNKEMFLNLTNKTHKK